MQIIDIETYFPKNETNNDDLEKMFPDWDQNSFVSKIGITNRYVASENETAVDMACEAAEELLNSNERKEIDFLLFCTQSPDHFLPTSACILQDRLGLNTNCGALDYNLGCSGYIYGLALAKGLFSCGIAKKILLITSETYSKHIYNKDIGNLSMFGDAAAATLLENCDSNNSFGKFVLGTDGSGASNLIVNNGGFRAPLSKNTVERSCGSNSYYTDNHLFMNGPEIFNFTLERIPQLVDDVLLKNRLSIEEIDYFIFHQANKFMLKHLMMKINIPAHKFYNNMEYCGNTVSSTIPIALNNCISEKKIKKGDKVMLVGFGVGYSWGATIITL